MKKKSKSGKKTENRYLVIWAVVIIVVALMLFFVKGFRGEKVKKAEKSEYTSEQEYDNARTYEMKYPIVKELPMVYAKYEDNYEKYIEFRIDGGKFSECEKEFCLMITDVSGDDNYKKAINEIKKLNYNPDDYEIKIRKKPIEPLP